ncbi:ureidoglycolate hydrolase-like protein [Calycina marina]|uniref:Ureidoglycolate hydrolase-like protein n=1 Tax=Calycina marina TaxID=1763456 RepID=A0A9P8CI73_9HELO|nr:ureidoglycolate hydrolase-like protein [Calycina marina]
MAPIRLQAPSTQSLSQLSLLSQDTFARFGDVIENPAPSLVPSKDLKVTPPGAVLGNQGSALVYSDVSIPTDLGGTGKNVMRMFVCAPRSLQPSKDSSLAGILSITILERHPYTTQTFIPLGLSAAEAKETRYLVIVAPTLPPTLDDEHLPVPTKAKRGLPDIRNIEAFTANGSQAVTYGPGTWHAPMIVVGKKPISFVVTQAVSGVAIKDCQEVDWKAEKGREVVVAVPKEVRSNSLWTSKL